MTHSLFQELNPVRSGSYLSGVTSSIQTQLNNCATKANPTFTVTVTIPGATSSGVLTCISTMGLDTNLTGARVVLYPGTGNEWC